MSFCFGRAAFRHLPRQGKFGFVLAPALVRDHESQLMDPSCIDHLAFAVSRPHGGARVMHLLLINQIVRQKILAQLRPDTHD